MISEQLIALMYGALVTETIKTSQHLTQANERLFKIGYRIGLKIVDEFMRENPNYPMCQKFSQVADKFCTIGVRRFITPLQTKCQQFKQTEKADQFSFNLKIIGNPILRNVQIPADLKSGNLQYQSIFKGIIKGAFEITIIYENLKGQKNETVFFVEAKKQ